MPKRKRSEIEEEMARLQEELASADDDDELWVEHPSGARARLTGSHRSRFLASIGLGDEEPAGAPEPEGEPEGEPEPDPQPKQSVWGRK
jgi:hypothetical protein